MNYTVTRETFDSLAAYWAGSKYHLNWSSIFVLPEWLRTWWGEFASGAEPYLVSVRGADIIGIAPLQLKEGKAAFIGSIDVCDYIDFIVAPGKERDFCKALLDDLESRKVAQLDLGLSRPESIVVTYLTDAARERGYSVSLQQEEVSLECDLPVTWDEYLELLGRKQRHELKRKLRRLGEAGEINYRIVGGEEAGGVVDTFFKLFKESREDKAAFLTAPMESFFRSIVMAMKGLDLLRFGIMELDGKPVAMVMYFDYNGIIYLYNSGYDREYSSLSVGFLSKALLIKDSIEKGRKRFDFLKGNEPYKYLLGGQEVPLYRCQITLP